jgi:hypothetical protein
MPTITRKYRVRKKRRGVCVVILNHLSSPGARWFVIGSLTSSRASKIVLQIAEIHSRSERGAGVSAGKSLDVSLPCHEAIDMRRSKGE